MNALLLAGIIVTGVTHLDCRWDFELNDMVCPPNLALPAPPMPEPGPEVKAGKRGSPGWNARCARRFKSFNPKTGNYKAYSGRMKRCDPDLPR